MANSENVIHLPRYIRLKKYEEISGVTQEAFRGKIKRSQLIQGRHYRKAPDGSIFVDWQEMDSWVESHG
jgi:hypothetical protein